MNRKIYFDDKFIEFVEDSSQSSQNQEVKNTTLVETETSFISAVKKFLEPGQKQNLLVKNLDFNTCIDALKKQFYYIEAAGGFIENNQKYLFIRRHQRWDLPKGKLEKNEKIKEAAVRECEEECGIQELSIGKQLSSTFHIYPFKNGHALKQSYWFYMRSDYAGPLVPQLEEDITEVKWFSLEEIKRKVLTDTYYTIRDVCFEALNT